MSYEIRRVSKMARFESWAKEDFPVLIDPNSVQITNYRSSDFEPITDIYQRAFNAQNQRKYSGIKNARLIWDEEPWTRESAASQLEEELSDRSAVCKVARAKLLDSKTIQVGFIIARLVDLEGLSAICGLESLAGNIIDMIANGSDPLLWEDAAVLNLQTEKGETVRGVGTSLYKKMAEFADGSLAGSIGRTSPGSFAEKILPKVGFNQFEPRLNDGKDRQRYWLGRKPKV